ncbi:hypothetical protein Dimus_016278, partial [Dionaea muscipula]
ICGDFLVKVGILGVFDCRSPRGSCGVALVADGAGAQGDSASGHKQEEQAVDLGVVVVKRATVKKSAQVAKISNPRATAAAENIKQQRGEQRVDLGLPTAIDLGAGKEAAAKAQNGGERKCEAAVANVIIISTETSNGRAVKERSRKKKTGGGPTFTSLLSARSKEAAAIGGVVRKREDLIIVNIDEASGDDELAVAEYAEDIYKFYKLIEVN